MSSPAFNEKIFNKVQAADYADAGAMTGSGTILSVDALYGSRQLESAGERSRRNADDFWISCRSDRFTRDHFQKRNGSNSCASLRFG